MRNQRNRNGIPCMFAMSQALCLVSSLYVFSFSPCSRPKRYVVLSLFSRGRRLRKTGSLGHGLPAGKWQNLHPSQVKALFFIIVLCCLPGEGPGHRGQHGVG